MRRAELERRLVEFVTRLARETDPATTVDERTPLFEEGVIDSLRILDLIAFVEGSTGTSVPDAAVRLANFRSIRVIARAFAEDGRGESADPGDAPLHVFGRRAGRAAPSSPVEALEARGEWSVLPPGRAALSGVPARLMEQFDAVVSGWARRTGAEEVSFPGDLPRETLSRAGRPSAPASPPRVVPPAVCYHVYHAREGDRLDGGPALLTARGRCFRDEAHPEPALGRLRDFEMREIVALGTREEVERFRTGWITRVRGLVEALELEGRIVTATDPFFLPDPARGPAPDSRGRRLVQRVLPLKYELRLVFDSGGRDCAVASFNHHLAFFGRRFGIRLASGATAHTGCVAFGLERWVLALLARHGADERAWPHALRDLGRVEVEA